MSTNGTSLYSSLNENDMPSLVWRAVSAAVDLGFELCVHPATGRLLQCLAGGIPVGGLVGETGTGTGVGLAWMVSQAHPTVRFVSAEIDPDRAVVAQRLFADHPNVTVLEADAGELFDRGPFDLLVHDGGWGTGKSGGERVDTSLVLKEGGLMTIDDFTPMQSWPPLFGVAPDEVRSYWLTHPDLLATEIRVAPEMAVIVARRTTRAAVT